MVQTQIHFAFLITESGSLVTNPRLFIGQILIHYVWFMCFQQESSTDQFLIVIFIFYIVYFIYIYILYTHQCYPHYGYTHGAGAPSAPTSRSADLGVVSGAEASPASPAPFRGFWCLGGHLWKITIFPGKIHYFYGHVQLQTVSSPEDKFPHGNGEIHGDILWHFVILDGTNNDFDGTLSDFDWWDNEWFQK